MPNFFDNLQLYLRLRLKLKKILCISESNQPQWLKPYIEFNTQERIGEEKNWDKYGKALYILMNNVVYRKTMEIVWSRIDVKLVNNDKDYLKCTSKPSYLSHKISDNNFVAI